MIDDAERQRRFSEGLCGSCATPLPGDAAYSREFCGATCRQRNHRALKRAGAAVKAVATGEKNGG